MEHSPKSAKGEGLLQHELMEQSKSENAVVKSWITEEEFEEITGESY